MSKSQTSNTQQPTALLLLFDARKAGDATLASLLSFLSAEEYTRHEQFIRAERRRQFALGRLLLRHAVMRAANVAVEDIRIVERPGQGPQVRLSGAQDLHVSLSHSREWIACAISRDCAVGVDVEVIDPLRDVIALAETAFDPNERQWLRHQPEAGRTTAFYRIWTLKEALFKLRSNTGSQTAAPPVVEGDALLSEGGEWFASHIAHPELSITLSASRKLFSLDREELPSLTLQA